MMTKMGLSPACRHEESRHYRANTTAAEAPISRVGGSRESASSADSANEASATRGDSRREYLGDWLDGRDPTGIGQNVSQVNK